MENNEAKPPPISSPVSLDVRENMIATAVKFLQNPKVRNSSFEQRKGFLKRKGLTDAEIKVAVDRSGTAQDEQQIQTVYPGQTKDIVTSSPLALPVSKWQKAKDFTATIIVIGGFSYVVYIVYKKYIARYFFGPNQQEKQLEELTHSIKELQQTLSEMIKNMEETSRGLSKQQENIRELTNNPAINRSSSELTSMQSNQSFNEIKEEIRSLKGLLLSRRQFPAAPVSTPVIPSWQLNSKSSVAGTSSIGPEDGTSMQSNSGDVHQEQENGMQPLTDTVISAGDEDIASLVKKVNNANSTEIQEESTENDNEDLIPSDTQKEDKFQAISSNIDTTINGETIKDSAQDIVNQNEFDTEKKLEMKENMAQHSTSQIQIEHTTS